MNKPGLLDFDTALAQLLAGARDLGGVETIPTLNATGRVLAAAQRSTVDVPPLDNTSMDGYAVRAADCASGSARLRVAQRIAAGDVGKTLEPGTAARIFTGAPIPRGADAVVMQEVCTVDGEFVVVEHAPKSGEWVRRAGEDIRKGAVILQAGTRLRPQEVGLAASVGLATLSVHRRLRVAVFFTGNELVMPGEPLPEGSIYNSNRFVLTGLLENLGCEIADLGIIPDNLPATREALRKAAAMNDLVVTSGGMSVGEEDHIKPAVEAEGRIDMWKLAIKPGRPLAFGSINRGSLHRDNHASAHFIGLPGNPVSAFVTFALFVRPFILRCQGVADVTPARLPLRADFDWKKPDARREFLRVKLNAAGGLDLFSNQGSAVLTSTVWGDGLVDNPPGRAIARGETVAFIPFASLVE